MLILSFEIQFKTKKISDILTCDCGRNGEIFFEVGLNFKISLVESP